MRIPIFVSCPSRLNASQERSRRAILRELERQQLEPRALGRSDYPSDFPLREVYVIAKHCSGGIILGFRQFVAKGGVWNPQSKEQRRENNPVYFPTAWNHLETGILFGLRLPILIFREEPMRGGVFDEGVTDIFIHSMPPGNIAGFALESFQEVLLKWSARVRDHYSKM